MREQNFSNDLKNEKLVNNILLNRLKNNFQIKETTLEEDYQGGDLLIKNKEILGDDNYHYLDIKNTVNYRKSWKDRKYMTENFPFEFEYTNGRGKRKWGWLLDADKKTEYYLLIWTYVKNKNQESDVKYLLDNDDLFALEYFLISKKDIIKYIETELKIKVEQNYYLNNLKNIIVNDDKYTNKIDNGYTKKLFSKIEDFSGNKPFFAYSYKLKEKPINLLLNKYSLLPYSLINEIYFIKGE